MSIHFCKNLAFSQCFPLVFIVFAVDFAIYPLSRSTIVDPDIYRDTFQLRKTRELFSGGKSGGFYYTIIAKIYR